MFEKVFVVRLRKNLRRIRIGVKSDKEPGEQQSGIKELSEFQFELGLRCTLGHRLSSIRQNCRAAVKEWVVIS